MFAFDPRRRTWLVHLHLATPGMSTIWTNIQSERKVFNPNVVLILNGFSWKFGSQKTLKTLYLQQRFFKETSVMDFTKKPRSSSLTMSNSSPKVARSSPCRNRCSGSLGCEQPPAPRRWGEGNWQLMNLSKNAKYVNFAHPQHCSCTS